MNSLFPPSSNQAGPAGGNGLPLVAIPRNSRSAWWFAVMAIVAAALLLMALESRRLASVQTNADKVSSSGYAIPEVIPELAFHPDSPEPVTVPQPSETFRSRGTVAAWGNAPRYAPAPASGDRDFAVPATYPSPLLQPVQDPAPRPAEPNAGTPRPTAPASSLDTALNTERLEAGRLKNPATTVVQGTLINAVLETALDSTRPGPARAVVTRDVYGFDGSMLLVPRGSRLFGAYDAGVSQGEDRLQIRWTRLLRPDGVTVAINSPATDPLGRAGVAAKVDNHFFQRLGNSLIGLTTNIGSSLLTRNYGSTPVVVAVSEPGRGRRQGEEPSDTQISPTLRVKQGSRLSVVVQHDLDFSTVYAEQE